MLICIYSEPPQNSYADFNISLCPLRLLSNALHMRVSELAYAVGYNDPRYFSVCFKKEIGMQPSEYMEKFTTGGTVEDDM